MGDFRSLKKPHPIGSDGCHKVDELSIDGALGHRVANAPPDKCKCTRIWRCVKNYYHSAGFPAELDPAILKCEVIVAGKPALWFVVVRGIAWWYFEWKIPNLSHFLLVPLQKRAFLSRLGAQDFVENTAQQIAETYRISVRHESTSNRRAMGIVTTETLSRASL